VAVPDLVKACSDCDILVFVLPHQFLANTCEQLVGNIKPQAVGVSLIKVFFELVVVVLCVTCSIWNLFYMLHTRIFIARIEPIHTHINKQKI